MGNVRNWKRGCGLTKFQVKFYQMIGREIRRRKRGALPVIVDCLRMLEVEATDCKQMPLIYARGDGGKRIFN